MKKIKKLFYMLALLLLIGGASLGLSEKTVEASSGVIALRNNRVYRTYDLDGNRRKDSIMLKTTGKRYNLSASFYVNGKKVYSLPKKDCYSARYRMITLKMGNILFTRGQRGQIRWYLHTGCYNILKEK